MLVVSPGLSLPEEAVTRSFGILGMRGSGKSNAAVVLAEEMFKAGLHWVAIDPKGDWWGIRSSADAKGPGLPVVIFGGEHADVPLEPTSKAGVLVADLVLNEGITCVLDLSEFTKGGKIAFLAGVGAQEGFAGRLFRKKKREQEPIHVFLEEAHDYVPQQARGDVAKLIDAVSSLQTMGRTKGLGCSVLSQRSARVHKDVLTQVDTLVAFRTISPQDRDAVEKWIKHYGLAEELVASLPGLADGEAWVWSPEWLGTLERIRFRRRETYDSGATPIRGTERRRPATLADVDLAALEAQMKETIERAKADDPKELRRRIAELEKELRAKPIQTTESIREVEVPVEVRVPEPIFPEDTLLRMEAALAPAVGLLGELQELAVYHREERIKELDKLRERRDGYARGRTTAEVGVRIPPPAPRVTKRGLPSAPESHPEGEGPKLSKDSGERTPVGRILDSLAWLESVRIPEAKKTQLALLAEASPTSSSYGNNLGSLRSAGLIHYPGGGLVALTDAGREVADLPDIPPTTDALLAQLFSRLPRPQVRILEYLVVIYPDACPKGELADRAEASVTSSSFGNNLGALRSLGLIAYPAPGFVVALPVLFLEEGAA